MAQRVGLIGIGNMGFGMALRLQQCGHAVHVRDIEPAREAMARERGFVVQPTAAALAALVDVLIVAVVDATQAEEVLFGSDAAAATLPRGATVLLCPTIAPADTERLAARLVDNGLAPIDAPMSGGPQRAADGTMSLMVACADTTFEQVRGVLDALSNSIFRLGARIGDAARMKLVNNLLAGINLAGAAEALALAERIGLDVRLALGVIERSSGQSWIGSDRLRRAIDGDYAPRAHTTLLNKDTHLALAMASLAGSPTPIGVEAAAVFARACEAGFAGSDDASVFELLRRRGEG